jgi:hypothetical protein
MVMENNHMIGGDGVDDNGGKKLSKSPSLAWRAGSINLRK